MGSVQCKTKCAMHTKEGVRIGTSISHSILCAHHTLVFTVYGPVSGGTRIRVKGTNLHIGNTEMTRVIMRESLSRKKRNTCPDVNCTIM